jgi:arylsulfatase A-like enzyme
MRKTRFIENCRCYHLISRLAHQAFFLDDDEKTRAVELLRRVEKRVRDKLWQRAVRTDRWKVIAIDDFTKPVEAYDLVADPGETNNLVRACASLPKEAQDLIPHLKPNEK